MGGDFIDDTEKKQRLEQWMQEYGTDLLRMNFMYVKDLHIAEDITQETFIKAYCQWEKYRGEASEKTWLTRIAINLCKDVLRRQWKKKLNETIDFESAVTTINAQEAKSQCSGGMFSEQTTVEEQFVAEERNLELMKAVQQLSPKNKEIIILYYYQELSMKEIGQALKVPQGTIAGRLRRARMQLKKNLKGWWDDEKGI